MLKDVFQDWFDLIISFKILSQKDVEHPCLLLAVRLKDRASANEDLTIV